MLLNNEQASLYVPGRGECRAQSAEILADLLGSTTHLGIGAHPDDVEFMVWQGILQCYQDEHHRFASIVITNGQGSSRVGPYAHYSDEQMVAVRREEQHRVADAGGYSVSVSLGYTSAELRQTAVDNVCADLQELLRLMRPQVIFTHNLADRHDSHVATVLRVVRALRELGEEYYPQRFLGYEVWRSLDWLTGEDRQMGDVSARPNLMRALMGLYDSQIAGGKSYDLANFGRRQGNATYNDAYHADASSMLELSMDLRPLLLDASLDPIAYFEALNDNFRRDVRDRMQRMS